jgi:hypothetical protein
MRKPAALLLAIAFALCLAPREARAHDHEAGAEADRPGSWKGEIVDVACYVPHGARGAGHADCAKKCAAGGQPIGLLTTDGDLFVLAADHEDGKPFEEARKLAGASVEVTGTMSVRGDTSVVVVQGVKAAQP